MKTASDRAFFPFLEPDWLEQAGDWLRTTELKRYVLLTVPKPNETVIWDRVTGEVWTDERETDRLASRDGQGDRRDVAGTRQRKSATRDASSVERETKSHGRRDRRRAE